MKQLQLIQARGRAVGAHRLLMTYFYCFNHWHVCKDKENFLCLHKYYPNRKDFRTPVSKPCETGTWWCPLQQWELISLEMPAAPRKRKRVFPGLVFGSGRHTPALCCQRMFWCIRPVAFWVAWPTGKVSKLGNHFNPQAFRDTDLERTVGRN